MLNSGKVTEWQRKELANHELVPVTESEKIKAYYIKKPGTRTMSTLLVFTPEGIALMGDLTPTRHGTVSCLGYGLNWFTGQLSSDYLCSKFLEEDYLPELGRRRILEGILEQRREKRLSQERARELWNACPEEPGPEEYWNFLADNLYIPDETPMDYRPEESSWLCAIQERFRELYYSYQEKRQNGQAAEIGGSAVDCKSTPSG